MKKQKLSKEHKEVILEQLETLNALVLKYVDAEIWQSQNQKLYHGLADLNKSLKAFEIETEADPWETFHELRARLIRNSGQSKKYGIEIFEHMTKIADDHNFNKWLTS